MNDAIFQRLFGLGGLWRLGGDVPGTEPSGARYLPVILRLPKGLHFGKLLKVRSDIPGVIFPPLWERAFAGPGPHAIPLILDLESKPPLPPLEAAFRIAVQLLQTAFSLDLEPASTGASRIGIVLGAPLANVSTAIPPAPPDSEWMPDTTLIRDPGRTPLAVVAVVDDGLPFAHRSLRDASGRSRVEFCWLQNAPLLPDGTAPGTPLVMGREYSRPAIDSLIAASGGDEDYLYASAKAFAPGHCVTIARAGTHGSHVIAAAAGGAPDHLRIVAAELAPPAILDTTGESQQPVVLAALHYAFACADRIEDGYKQGTDETPLPLVVNLSYGYTGGAHDGTGILTEAIANLVATREACGKPTCITLAAGNTFQDRLYGRITPEALTSRQGEFEIPWRIQPGDRTASPLHLWFAAGADLSGLALEMIDPAGFTALQIAAPGLPPAKPLSIANAAGEVVGRCGIGHESLGRPSICIRLNPTEAEAGARARAGLWRIRLRAGDVASLAGPIDCRILRDIDPLGHFGGARQSHFDTGETLYAADGTLREEDDPNGFLRRFGTINDLASGSTVVVAGCDAPSGEPSGYSAAAAIGSATSPQIDCAVPSETDHVLEGWPGAGTRSGATFRLSGTSTAAPRAARKIADALLQRELDHANRKPVRPLPGAAGRIGPVGADELHATSVAGGDASLTARLGRFRLPG